MPCTLHHSTLVNDQFWALLPPAFAATTASPPDSTASSDALASNSAHPFVSSALSRGSTTRADSTARGASPWDYMQLLKLVDSDDILVPRWNQASSSPILPSSVTPSITADGRSTLVQVPPTPVILFDTPEPPREAPEQQAAQQEEEDEDEMMMQDVAEYLQASLERSFGAPEKYNPMLCASGTINNLVRDILVYFHSLSSVVISVDFLILLHICSDLLSSSSSAKHNQLAMRAPLLCL